MSSKISKASKSRLVAKLIKPGDEFGPCAFCQREVNDEVGYGNLYSIGELYCHYYCVLLSCCLVQKGEDEDGLLGFLYPDIIAEIERSKKHRCSYCGKGGATIGCCETKCRKQFHLPCGRAHHAVNLFYGIYKSFCEKHSPKQNIPAHIMEKVQQRRIAMRQKQNSSVVKEEPEDHDSEVICVICYEPTLGSPNNQTFWSPCCARDAWFHRPCLERMALSAGAHFLKCPLCNDKATFYKAVLSQGYFVPDRDASWELEGNAFADIYSRAVKCVAATCHCKDGREYDLENTEWDIQLCLLCGNSGSHLACMDGTTYLCKDCKGMAPEDLQSLQNKIKDVILQEQQAKPPSPKRPLMPSRMSIRNTKQHLIRDRPSTSRQQPIMVVSQTQKEDRMPQLSSEPFSPIKFIQSRMPLDEKDLERLREKFKKPGPMCVKRKIVNLVLQEMLLDQVKKSPTKSCVSPNKDIEMTNSPVKNHEIFKTPEKLCIQDAAMEISEHNETINIDIFKVDSTNDKSILKDSTAQRPVIENINAEMVDQKCNIDMESFKNQYLNEVTNHTCSFNHKHDDKNSKTSKLKTAIDFAIDAAIKKENDCQPDGLKKSKSRNKKKKSGKKNKMASKDKCQLKLKSKNSVKIKVVYNVDSNKSKKQKNRVSIKNEGMNLKIKWKSESKKRKHNKNQSISPNTGLKQSKLKFDSTSPDQFVVTNTSPRKKFVKKEKLADSLKQTSLFSFFKPQT